MNCPSCGHENIDGTDRCENCLTPFRNLDVPRVDSAEGLARSVMEDNLSHLDQEHTVTVAPETTAVDVVRRMKDANSGCALVLDGKKLLGIFTEHDVLLKMTGPGSAGISPANEREARTVGTQTVSDRLEFVEQVPVKDLMTPHPEFLHEKDSVAAALNKMSMRRYRHIPVLKSDGTYTVASIKSVLNYIAQEDW
jgi:CBS domain-containing protein